MPGLLRKLRKAIGKIRGGAAAPGKNPEPSPLEGRGPGRETLGDKVALPGLKIATFNAENFYLLLDREYTTERFLELSDAEVRAMNPSIYNPNKSLSKIRAIADTIVGRDFDFVGLCEVGGMETLRNFNRHYLGGRYDCFLHEENSRRGIFVGALVKRGVFSRARARNSGGGFSRNLLEVRLDYRGVDLLFFVAHLKSARGDDLGIGARVEEVKSLCALLRPRNCVVMGDFNGIAIRGAHQFEFDPLMELPFRDVLEAMGVPPADRFTHFHFGRSKNFNQLDYLFCSEDMGVTDGGAIVDYVPLTYAERSRMPSDHVFLTATVVPSGGGTP